MEDRRFQPQSLMCTHRHLLWRWHEFDFALAISREQVSHPDRKRIAQRGLAVFQPDLTFRHPHLKTTMLCKINCYAQPQLRLQANSRSPIALNALPIACHFDVSSTEVDKPILIVGTINDGN
ncbi:MAG: hypothetical protein KF693_08650 [Nitrospira sp.]|nr:hypothetical protein [Nitrospira sp.]